METTNRKKLELIEQDLLANAHDYQLHQLLRLFDKYFAAANIKLIPTASLAFPAADITKLEQENTHQYLLFLNLLGIYGADSPLPHYLLLETINQDENQQALRDFLMIFQQRIYDLFHKIWQQTQRLFFAEINREQYAAFYYALAGKYQNIEQIKFFGLLGKRIHSTQSLKSLLQKFLRLPVTIEDQQISWSTFSKTCILGKNFSLGINTFLGTQFADKSKHLLITIKTSNKESALILFPQKAKTMIDLIKSFLSPTHAFILQITTMISQAKSITCGDANLVLGTFNALGTIENKQESLLWHFQ